MRAQHADDRRSSLRACPSYAGRRGVVQLRELVALADGRAESQGESGRASRCMTTAFHGLSSNWWVYVEGVPTFRLDLAYPRAQGRDRVRRRGVPLVTRGQASRHGPSGVARTTRMGGDRGRQGLVHRRGARRLDRATCDGHSRTPTARPYDGTCGREAQLARTLAGRNSRVPDTQLRAVPEAQLAASGEGGAHGGEGGGEAGELLELEGGLVDEEVEARDQYLVPAGPGQPARRAPTGRAGWATGGRRPRRRPVRPRTARPRRRSGRRPGWWRRRPRRPPRRRAATAPPRRARPGAGRGRPRRPRPATGSRTSSRIVAGAQVGQGQTRRRRGGSPAQDGRDAHRTGPHGPDRRRRPGDVGVVGVPPAVRVHEGVGHPRSYHRRRHLIGTRRPPPASAAR